MACGGDALAADERAPGAVAIWWLDGDSQVLDYDVTHVQPTQHGQPALPVPVFDAFRWAWRRCPNRHVRHTGKVGSGGSCTAVHGTSCQDTGGDSLSLTLKDQPGHEARDACVLDWALLGRSWGGSGRR